MTLLYTDVVVFLSLIGAPWCPMAQRSLAQQYTAGRGWMATLPPTETLRREIEDAFGKVLTFGLTSRHSWAPRVVLFGSRAQKTESAWSDFDFIVEVPKGYSQWNRIYRQLFRARLAAMDLDIGRKVTTKNASHIEEANDTVKWMDKQWVLDVSLRVATQGRSAQQLQTTSCLLQLYEDLHGLKDAVVLVTGVLRANGAMPAHRTPTDDHGRSQKAGPIGDLLKTTPFSCWLHHFMQMIITSVMHAAS